MLFVRASVSVLPLKLVHEWQTQIVRASTCLNVQRRRPCAVCDRQDVLIPLWLLSCSSRSTERGLRIGLITKHVPSFCRSRSVSFSHLRLHDLHIIANIINNILSFFLTFALSKSAFNSNINSYSALIDLTADYSASSYGLSGGLEGVETDIQEVTQEKYITQKKTSYWVDRVKKQEQRRPTETSVKKKDSSLITRL